jgi:PAS domain S-box-containing protein
MSHRPADNVASGNLIADLLAAETVDRLGVSLLLSHPIVERHVEGRVREANESAEKYKAIVDTAFDAIVVSDKYGIIQSFNRAAELIFGYTSAEAVGRPITMLMPPDGEAAHEGDRPRYMRIGERRLAGGRIVPGLRKDGTAILLDLSIAEWRDRSGQRCFTGIFRDVTEQQKAQEALRVAKDHAEQAVLVEAALRHDVQKSNEELKAANNRLLKFTSIVAHDLRAPLSRVEAFVGVIREDFAPSFDEDGYDLLHRLEKTVQRMKMMLSALLNYSKYSRAAFNGKTTHLQTVIADVLATFDLAAIDARISVPLEPVALIEGDPMLIAHVLQNLVGNAIKFRSAGPLIIDISAASRGAMIEVAVADNGIGIEPEYADRVFEMFYRLHNEESYEGTGIGLTVCQQIVNDHGGEIHVDKNYRGGTKIVMTLPAAGVPDAVEFNPASSSGDAATAA